MAEPKKVPDSNHILQKMMKRDGGLRMNKTIMARKIPQAKDQLLPTPPPPPPPVSDEEV